MLYALDSLPPQMVGVWAGRSYDLPATKGNPP